MGRSLDLDELVEHWTLLDDEQGLIAGKRGPTRLGFALLLKFYTRAGRFPRGRGELPDEAVEFVARQVGVDPAELGFYEWSGSTIAYHRSQIRTHLGYRECSVADADKLTEWLAANVCESERRPELVRDELLARCRAERIEPPAAGRVDRIVRSALHQAEQTLTARIVARLPVEVAGRLCALVAVDVPDDDAGEDSVLALIKSVPGNVSLDSMLTEIRRLRAVRAIGLPGGLFGDVAPRVVTGWRARATVESPSHLRDHPEPLILTLLAALLHTRLREITDTLVELLISTVHRIGARADRKVTEELVNAFKRVTGKEKRGTDRPAELLDRGEGRVLGALGVEPAQDLLGLGGAQPQRGRIFDHLVVLLGDQVPVDGPGEHRFQARVHGAVAGPVEAGGADVLQPGQQPAAEQVGEGEPDHAGAVGVGVVGGDLRVDVGRVPDQALHHRRDLAGGAGLELGVHAHALALDVPVDHHTGPAVAGVHHRVEDQAERAELVFLAFPVRLA